MKRYRLREEMNAIPEPPGKSWFWELEAGVIDAGRCVQCGTCVAVCPSNSIGVKRENNLPELVKMCTGCSLCWDFCPRGGLRYEALWRLCSPERAHARPEPDAPPPLAATVGTPGADTLGAPLEWHSARAAARAPGAQDGGVVTALLGALLEAGAIDGALVSRPSDDPAEPWRGVATVATTASELAACAGSFYNQTMALAELDLSAYELADGARLAVVGTACQVQGIRAMQARPWDTGAHRVDAVVLTIALMCTKSFDYEGLVLRELAERRKVELERVRRIDITRGRLLVEYVDGTLAVDEAVGAFHGAALRGCEECADFLGRGADLSVGSVGSADGWTSVLVRTGRGRRAFHAARAALVVRDLADPEALARLDRLDRRTAESALQRPLDPGAPLFIGYEEHLECYGASDRRPAPLAR